MSAGQTCRRCGYDLRGLARDAACPECATPVALSKPGPELFHADPQWVSRLATGGRQVLNGLGLLIASVLVLILYNTLGPTLAQLLMAMGYIAAGILLLRGIWNVSTPQGTEPERLTNWIRGGALAGLIGLALDAVRGWLPPGNPLDVVLDVLLLLSLLSGAVGALCYLQRMRQLAERIPNAEVSSNAYYLQIAGGIWWLASAAVFVVSGFPSFGSVLVTAPILLISGFVMFLTYAALQDQFSKALDHQARRARESWQEGGGTL